MPVYPALDIINGGCVRLQQGDFARQTDYPLDPLEQARRYQADGAEWLHLVDLDGARCGQPQLLALIAELSQTGLCVQTGGGVRTGDHIEALLSAGASRVVVGSLAATEPERVRRWLHTFGSQRLTLALDARLDETGTPRLATSAWRETSGVSLWEMAAFYRQHGARHVLCTDIGRDGQMQGPSLKLYRQCQQRFPQLHWQASGGVHALEDIRAVQDTGLAGVVVGKALLEGVFTLKEALLCWQND